MRLIQIDVVGLQALERALNRLLDVGLAEPFFQPTFVAMTTLSRLPRVLIQRPMIVSDSADIAGCPSRIDIGSVDEIKACPDEFI